MTSSRLSAIRLLSLLAIILLAAFLRLYQIDTIPPGDRYDPAYYGVDALQILDGARPIFLPTNFGREALFSYLVTLAVMVLGAVPHAMYVTSAIVGILTVPAVYLLAEELFATEEGTLSRFGGLVAALATALSFWHLNWSRFGVRAILVPLFAALTFFFLWRALRTNSRWLFVAAGVFLGLGVYTYQVARLFPVLVVLAILYVALSRGRFTRRDLGNLLIVGLVALVVFVPLGYYFVTHPGSFFQRVEQTAIVSADSDLAGNLQAVAGAFVDTLLSFGVRGDLEPTTNLPGRPTLNGFLTVLLVAGVVISLLRIKRPAYLFLLTWLLLMIVPALLSQFGPIAKRVIGAFPSVMVLIAVGTLAPLEMLGRWAAGRKSGSGRVAMGALVAFLLVGFVYTAVLTYSDYFVVWAGDPDLFTHFEVGPTSVGQYVRTLPPEERIYVSPLSPDHPSVVYNAHMRPGIKGYDGRACIVIPEQTQSDTSYVIVPREDPNSLELLPVYFPQGKLAAEGPRHYERPYYLTFQVPEGSTAALTPSQPVEATWEDKIQLLGYDLDAAAYGPGDTVYLTLYFQALREMTADFTASVQILGGENPATGSPLWGQDDSEPCRRAYPTSSWAPGEILRDQYAVALPDTAPPGEYRILVGFYLLETLTRLQAQDAAGRPFPDDAVPLGLLKLGAGE